MKKYMLSAISAVALVASVSAADLPSKRAAYAAPAPTPIWTGFYAGINAGYAFGEGKSVVSFGSGWSGESAAYRNGVANIYNGKPEPRGFSGGIQGGYNHQFSNQFVLGLEADVNYTDLKKTRRAVGTVSSVIHTVTNTVESSWVATIRPRIGFAFDQFLVYGTGGLAIANLEGGATIVSSGNYLKAGSKDSTKIGWVAGAGVEYALNKNWSLKTEYLYTDLGKVKFTTRHLTGSSFTGYNESFSQDLAYHTVRVGVNYKF